MRSPLIARYARRYAEAGLALVHVPNGEKGPRHRGWNDPANAIADPLDAERFWSRNPWYGIAALLEPSRIVSLDIDDEPTADKVLAHLGVDLEALRATTPTVAGRHYRMIFRAPAEPLRHRSVAWPKRDNPLASGVILELRAGMVADTLPPSKHPTAGEYRWTVPPRNGFPALPGRLLELWRDWDATQRAALALCPWYTAPKPQPKAHRPIAPRDSVIQQFNTAHDPAALLEAHGYRRQGRRFASPETGHAAGVTLLDDGRAYCHHQGDPLATGRALDSFDLFRILDHGGDWRAAVKAAAAALGLNQSRAA